MTYEEKIIWHEVIKRPPTEEEKEEHLEAFDYDVRDDFGETDHVIELFANTRNQVERSLIHPQYANRLIRQYITGGKE